MWYRRIQDERLTTLKAAIHGNEAYLGVHSRMYVYGTPSMQSQ